MTPRVFQTKTNDAGDFVFNRAKIIRVLQSMAGQPIEIVIRPFDPKRPLNMNAYYWGVMVETIRKHFFYNTSKEVHENLKKENKEMLDPIYATPKQAKALKKILNFLFKPREIPMGYTTATLSRSRFYNYCESIKVQYAERGCYIPDPNECEV